MVCKKIKNNREIYNNYNGTVILRSTQLAYLECFITSFSKENYFILQNFLFVGYSGTFEFSQKEIT